ncbi:MAG: TRAP transporter TatT component family protein [Verrucomicrobiae bacterium]|nr:TRAP transporter TatT component family protein [Verrucomicrobiae bacterium]NNJ87544.1 hypothetical protein [Akkermansiaceae bacterium]
MMKQNLTVVCLFVLVLSTITGCIHVSNEYEHRSRETTPNTRNSILGFSKQVHDEDTLKQSIQQLEAYLRQHRDDSELWDLLASQLILEGAAYKTSKRSKRDCYQRAMSAAVASMKVNSGFADALRKGAEPWEAVEHLDQSNMNAMLFWTTGLLYQFRESMGGLANVVNVKWIDHGRAMINRMEAIDGNWNGGAMWFTKSLLFHAIPESVGGDKKLAQEYLQRAIDVSDDWMLARWGRAKYYSIPSGNLELAKKDLNIVIESPLNLKGEAMCWRRYFQREARAMLESIKSDEN